MGSLPRISFVGLAAAMLAAVTVHAATSCPPSAGPLLEVRIVDQVRQESSIEATFLCKNGLGTQTVANMLPFSTSPYVRVVHATSPDLVAALNSVLFARRVGTQTSCALPGIPVGRGAVGSQYVTLRWHGRGGRENTFVIGVGYLDLFPRCSAAAEALLDAVRAFGLMEVSGAEVYGAAGANCPPASSLLLEVRHEAQVTRLHPSVNTLTTVEGIFACKNALGVRTVAASASTFPIAPDVLVARASAPALAAVLSAALDQARAGALTSCSLPAPDGLSESFSFVWHGRGARVNRFAIAVGFSGLYPPCSAEAEALLFAVQAYAAGLPMAPGAEVDIFPH